MASCEKKLSFWFQKIKTRAGRPGAFYQAKIKNLTLSVYSPTDGPLPYSPN